MAAYEIYRRQYHARIDPEKVAELLILHPQHPRSIRFNIAALQSRCAPSAARLPVPTPMKPSGSPGKVNETLMYDRIQDIFSRGLHPFLTRLQKTCRSIGEHIARTYFYYSVVA